MEKGGGCLNCCVVVGCIECFYFAIFLNNVVGAVATSHTGVRSSFSADVVP